MNPSGSSEVSDVTLPRKASSFMHILPVPRTNTGARGEYPKASEITGAKELGKMTPYVRNKGCSLYESRSESVQPTVYQKHSSLLKCKLKYRG